MYSLSHDRERGSEELGEGKRGERERLLVRENVMELHTSSKHVLRELTRGYQCIYIL